MRGRFRFLTGSVLSLFLRLRILEPELASNVTMKGQVTLPSPAREIAGSRPGDRVSDRVRPEGGAIVETEAAVENEQAYLSRLAEMSQRRPICGLSTEDIMRMTRGED